jgi:hypothetical protein
MSMINKKQRSHVADHKGGDVRIIILEQHGQHASPLSPAWLPHNFS